jgi:phage anti-repressor protein
MNELIPVNYETEQPTVRGRELHKALEVTTPYHIWFPRMTEYGFKENKDYGLVEQICSTNNPKNPATVRVDHQLSIPMAKELCMLQRSEMGRKFRQYFIAVEEAWNSPEKILERSLAIARQKAREAERRIFALAEEKETLEIALNISLQYYTVAKYNDEFRMGWNMAACQRVGKRLAAYCRSRAIRIEKCKTGDERFSFTNSYPLAAWQDFMAAG